MPPKKQININNSTSTSNLIRKKRKQQEIIEENDYNYNNNNNNNENNNLQKFNLNKNKEINFYDNSYLTLKKDHLSRPLWITSQCIIILEAFSPLYQQAYDFIVSIAEPLARPEYIQRYQLTEFSLYAAVAVSIDTETIIQVLGRLCKTELPNEVILFIRKATATFGKAKLVLKDNTYFVESAFPDVLRKLLKNPIISECRIVDDSADTTDGFTRYAPAAEIEANLNFAKIGQIDEITKPDLDDDDDLDQDVILGTTAGKSRHIAAFKIEREKVELVKKTCLEMQYPLMEEYDFKNDSRNPTLVFDLKPSTRIRIYQEKSLARMFGNGRARSGIVVLPCGAGKSLTGVTAASTIKKSTVILCINNVSVKQWRDQLLQWTTIPPDRICLFTAQNKDQLPPSTEACIVLTTYTMLCFTGQRAESALPIIESIKNREWGLLILDEVHVAPAKQFRTVLRYVNAHCKMGLTATLVREDDLIADLNFLIGPKLYEANWMDLTQQGFLANVQCCEVWCPMTAEFYREYLRPDLTLRLTKLMYILNPNKFRVCEYLVNYHEERGDKIILFSDDVIALKLYSIALQRPFIFGETTEDERKEILDDFKLTKTINCIGLSKVGDTALDIPEANVIIQISSHFGARRQEAQRLGRILRPKQAQLNGFVTTTYNAFFYTLVSCDTREMYFSTKRQQYLVDQGYTFKVVQDLVDEANSKSKLLKTKSDEMNLLNKVLNVDLTLDEKEDRAIAVNYTGDQVDSSLSSSNQIKRKNIRLNEISNSGDDLTYNEYSTNTSLRNIRS